MRGAIKLIVSIIGAGCSILYADLARAQQDIQHTGVYMHPAAGALFPDRIGNYSRISITRYANPEDISANYEYRSRNGISRISVYIYPESPGRNGILTANAVEACNRHHSDVRRAITDEGRYRNARLLFHGRASQANGVDPQLTHWSAYAFNSDFSGVEEDLRSEAVLYCRVAGRWFVKYRVTSSLRIDGARALVEFQRLGPWPGQRINQTNNPSSPQSSTRPTLASAYNPRIALVVGVGSYQALGSLANPVSDARAIAGALRGLGFEVEMLLNPGRAAMDQAIIRFGQRMRRAGAGAAGLFYFAGHGVQANGVNYLLPSDARLRQEGDLPAQTVAADSVLSQMRQANVSTNIMILDACRNMPLGRTFLTTDRGLAQMNAPTGTFISYSTAPGDVAADGVGDNSPFTMAFVREISRSNETIELVFRNVRRSVLSVTGGGQTPWDASSLVEPFYFAPG